MILRRATDRAMSMRVPNLNYILLNNFEDIKANHFFQSQELLKGKSMCDICLNDSYSVIVAVDKWESFDKVCEGSVVHEIISKDKVRKDIFENVGFY